MNIEQGTKITDFSETVSVNVCLASIHTAWSIKTGNE